MKQLAPYFAALVIAGGAHPGTVYAAQGGAFADRTWGVVLPMAPQEAEKLMSRLLAKGLDKRWRRDFRDFLVNTAVGNSAPLLLPVAAGNVCLATALRYDIDKVMGFSEDKGEDTRQAVADFLLVHEASHCREILLRDGANPGWAEKASDDFEGIGLWYEEALADYRAREALRKQGMPGFKANAAWERRRLFDLLAGDLDHWTTPLVHAAEGHSGADAEVLAQAGAGLGGQHAYEALNRLWSSLVQALFVGADEGAEQAQAWEAASNAFPAGLRAVVPSLNQLRSMAREIWPDAPDWRLKAIGRDRAPTPRSSVMPGEAARK